MGQPMDAEDRGEGGEGAALPPSTQEARLQAAMEGCLSLIGTLQDRVESLESRLEGVASVRDATDGARARCRRLEARCGALERSVRRVAEAGIDFNDGDDASDLDDDRFDDDDDDDDGPSDGEDSTLSKCEKNWEKIQRNWEKMFRELQEFRRREGHCDVPHNYGTLGRWAHNQRTAHRAFRAGKGTKFARHRIEKLESIGFSWDAWTGKKSAWNTMIKELLYFKHIEGHCDVTPAYENRALVRWVEKQRKDYRAIMNGEQFRGRGYLTNERIKTLERLGFRWTIDRVSVDGPDIPMEDGGEGGKGEREREREEEEEDTCLPGVTHGIETAPRHASKYKDGQWICTSKQRYQQFTCRWPGCKVQCRTYCPCRIGHWLCPSHIVRHSMEATREACLSEFRSMTEISPA